MTGTLPTLSFVVAARDVAPYLGACLDSILRDPEVLEVVVVDDASVDATAAVLRDAEARDPRVRTVRNDVALGPGRARNVGLREARGDYVWFVDGDDWLLEGAVQHVLGSLVTRPDILVFDFVRAYPSGRVVPSSARRLLGRAPDGPFRLADWPDLVGVLHVPWNKVFRRRFLEDAEIQFSASPVYEDVSFTYAALRAADRIAVEPSPCYAYRTARPGALTRRRGAYHAVWAEEWDAALAAAADDPLPLRRALFARMRWHGWSVLGFENGWRIPVARRRDFFRRFATLQRAHRPDGAPSGVPSALDAWPLGEVGVLARSARWVATRFADRRRGHRVAAPTVAPGAPSRAPDLAPDRSVLATGRRHITGARGLVVNGGALVINVLVSAATGLGFWVLAARVAPPDVVARASAAITGIIAVVSLAQQHFVLTLPSLLSVSAQPRRLTRSVYGAALVSTAATAPVYVLLGPLLFGGLDFLHDWRMGLFFVIGSLVWCLFSLQDAVLTGLRKGTYVLLENASWGSLRLLALVALWALGASLGVGLVVATWVVPALALVAAVNWYLFGARRSPLREPRGTSRPDRRRMLSYMGAEYGASVLSSTITLVSTAYVLTTVGAAAAAPLLTAASFVVVVEGALAQFAQALAVEASRPEGARERRGSLIWISAVFLGVLSFGAIVVGNLFGEQIMSLLGSHYRESGGLVLGILMFAVPFRSISLVSNADNRIRGQGGRNLLQQVVGCTVCVTLLFSGQFTSPAAIAWVLVLVRVATAAVATVQLSQGRLQLHHGGSGPVTSAPAADERDVVGVSA